MGNIDPKELRDNITEQVLSHDYDSGSLLLLAGPGTGKTFSLLNTIKRQIKKGYKIEDFFEVTLTNAAVDDFTKDAKKEISDSYDSLSTLHFRAKGILHQYANNVGFNPGFSIINDFVSNIIEHDLSEIMGVPCGVISKEVSKYQQASANYEEIGNKFSDVYRLIQKYYSAIDWFDVVYYAVNILENNNEIKDHESSRFQFLLIDEYQDLNNADQRLIELLNNKRNTLLAVGDDDQSIYSGRYANPSGITNFTSRYPNAKVIDLPVSSRLPSNVISPSNNLICLNEDRYPKDKLIPLDKTEKRSDGGFVISVNNKSAKAENNFLAKALETLINNEIPPAEILVLCHCKKLGTELFDDIHELNNDLPIINYLSSDYEFDRDNYLLDSIRTLLIDPSDNLSIRLIIDALAEDHKEEIPVFVKLAFQENIALWEAMNRGDLTKEVPNLAPLLDNLSKTISSLLTINEIEEQTKKFLEAFDEITYLIELIDNDEENGNEKKLERKDKEDNIRFLSMHSSKGLDADYVFIPCLEESLSLPANDVNEKRRLLYVALTRAKIGAIISWSWSRRSQLRFKCSGTGGEVTRRIPSGFIQECGVDENIVPPWAEKESYEIALEILDHHSNLSKEYDTQ